MSATRLAVSGLPPDVFEHLVGVEKMRAIEQIKTASQTTIFGRRCAHLGQAFTQISKNIPILISHHLSLLQ